MTKKAAVLVTGSRDFTLKREVEFRMRKYPKGTVFIHGNANGADTLCLIICLEDGYPQAQVPYFHWLGKGGGPARNKFMLDILIGLAFIGYKASVEAFPLPESRGTRNMIDQATKAGIKIWEYGKDDRNG
jgi:hypothetical protein